MVSVDGGTSIAGWFIMENPNLKWMLFRKPPYIYIYGYTVTSMYVYIYNGDIWILYLYLYHREYGPTCYM